MNDIQAIIDRQLGFYCRFNYDNILKRLVVRNAESFYGLQTGTPFTPADQDPPIFACRFAETAGYDHILALANEDGRVAIQDTMRTHAPDSLQSFQCHNNAVFDLAWMPGQMNFVTVSGDHTACLWDVTEAAPKRTHVFSSHTRSVKTAVFRPNEPSVFATGARDGHILVWDIRAQNQPCVVVKPDNWLMSCHSSLTPKTPGSHGKRPRIDNQRAISITGLVFQDDLTLLSCGECDGNIKVWDLRKNYNIYKREPLPKHSIPYCGSSTKNGYTNLIVDDARVRLYASCMDNVIYCFNISTYNALPERRYVGHENGTFYIKTGLSPDGRYLASGSSDKSAYIWSVRSSRPLVRLSGHAAEVTCAAWLKTVDPALVTAGDDARHYIWRIGNEDEDALTLQAKAESVPRPTGSIQPWGKRDGPPLSPISKKRRVEETPRRSKRCLNDLLYATPDEIPTKKLKMEVPLSESQSPNKRPAESVECPILAKERRLSKAEVTPTKNEEARKSVSPNQDISWCIADLPNFVLHGEAPHLRLMSPVKKRGASSDWLTALRVKRPLVVTQPPPSPDENAAPRKMEKTPKAKNNRTLLKYFTVASKQK